MPDIEMEAMEKLTEMERHVMEFLNNLMDLLKRMTASAGQKTDGIEAIQEWMLNGGSVKNTILSVEDAKPFGDLMRKNHIPFTAFSVAEGEDKKVAYVFRDKDAAIVRDILEKDLKVLIDERCKELDIDTFQKLFANENVAEVSNIDKTTLYAFREAAQAHAIRYLVLSGEDGTYRILADNEKALHNVMSDTMYNLTAPGGKEYKEKLEEYIDSRAELLDRMPREQGKELYIMDMEDMSNITSVNHKTHTNHYVNQTDDNGESVLYDQPFKPNSNAFNSQHLINSVVTMKFPVIFTAEELAGGISGKYKGSEELKLTDNAETFFADLKAEYEKSKKYIRRDTDLWEKIPSRAGQEIYIVDAKNPQHIITANNSRFMEHTISRMETDGTVSYIDTSSRRTANIKSGKESPLLEKVAEMKVPVIFTARELSAGIAEREKETGKFKMQEDAQAVADFFAGLQKEYEEIPEEYESVLKPLQKRRYEHLQAKDCKVFNRVPFAALQKIKRFESEQVYIQGQDMVISNTEYELNRQKYDSILYGGLSPLQAKLMEIHYAGGTVIPDIHHLKEPLYLLNPDNRDFVISITGDGFDLIKSGEPQIHRSIDSPDYERELVSIIDTIQKPIMIDDETYHLPAVEWAQAISDRLPENIHNEALEYIEHFPENEKARVRKITKEDIMEGQCKKVDKDIFEKLCNFPIVNKLLGDDEYTYNVVKTGERYTEKTKEWEVNR